VDDLKNSIVCLGVKGKIADLVKDTQILVPSFQSSLKLYSISPALFSRAGSSGLDFRMRCRIPDVSRDPERRHVVDIEIWPYRSFLEELRSVENN